MRQQETYRIDTIECDQSNEEGKGSEDVSQANMNAPEDCWALVAASRKVNESSRGAAAVVKGPVRGSMVWYVWYSDDETNIRGLWTQRKHRVSRSLSFPTRRQFL